MAYRFLPEPVLSERFLVTSLLEMTAKGPKWQKYEFPFSHCVLSRFDKSMIMLKIVLEYIFKYVILITKLASRHENITLLIPPLNPPWEGDIGGKESPLAPCGRGSGWGVFSCQNYKESIHHGIHFSKISLLFFRLNIIFLRCVDINLIRKL